jgi:hypothetical protein
LWKSFRAQAERGSGIGLKLFGFIAESVFTFIPERCSGSPRNTVRNHPGIAFTLNRNPHPGPTKVPTPQFPMRPAAGTGLKTLILKYWSTVWCPSGKAA